MWFEEISSIAGHHSPWVERDWLNGSAKLQGRKGLCMCVYMQTLMKQTAAFSAIKTIIYLIFPRLKTPWVTHMARTFLGHGQKNNNNKKKLRKKELSLRGGGREALRL